MKGHQAENSNSDCDGRNQNPFPPLPILHHPDTILAFSIQILAARSSRFSALESLVQDSIETANCVRAQS
jgi:hypothetical protein